MKAPMTWGGKVLIGGALALGTFALSLPTAAASDSDVTSGQSLFVDKCGGCHLEGGFGTRVLARRVPEGEAPLAARKSLPAAYVTMVVRRGIGSMPQIREAELADDELAAIAAYLDRSK